MVVEIERVLHSSRSKYQEIVVADSPEFGRVLVLDGLIQSSTSDEHYYHESLVHPAMVTHGSPRRVLIIGGGEGATLREVLRWRSVEEAVMVDIDGDVVEASRRLLSDMHGGSFYDKRARVVIMDGLAYVDQAVRGGEKFDVVILDLTDPYGPEISKLLYSADFYRKVRALLNGGGVMVTQAGSSFFFEDVYREVLSNVRQVFELVREYNVWVPAFGYAVNFIIASLGRDPAALSAEEVDAALRANGVSTRFYSGRTHVALMNLPIYYRSR